MPEIKTKSRRARRPRALPQISDAEWVVMKVLWREAPLATQQVVDALEGQADWKPKTIHTLLSRLARKGALAFEKQGRQYFFRPLVSADECEHAVTRSFLDRFFGGDLAPFLARFVEKQQLTPPQITRLKKILERKSS